MYRPKKVFLHAHQSFSELLLKWDIRLVGHRLQIVFLCCTISYDCSAPDFSSGRF